MLAPAKLNLRLRVLGQRVDGYHSIETLFLRLGLADELVIDEAPGLRLEARGDFEVPAGATNIAWRAADAFFEKSGRSSAASIHLVKRIPVAAGLGGGSSDAASVLAGLNQRHDHLFDREQLMALAGRLGSDVPFFLAGVPFALAWGRGCRLLPLTPPPSRPVLVIVPDFGVSAADAYAWRRADIENELQRDWSAPGELPPAAELADWDVLSGLAVNDLQPAVLRRHAELRAAADALACTGPKLMTLCGSGSCLAGIFRTESERDHASEELSGAGVIGFGWKLISTWTEGPGESSASG